MNSLDPSEATSCLSPVATRRYISGWFSVAGLSLVWLWVQAVCLAAAPAAPAASSAVEPAPPARFVPSVYKSFAAWKTACDRLPSNRSIKLQVPAKDLLPLKSFSQFAEVLNGFFNLERASSLAQTNAWLGSPPLRPQFFNTDAVYFLKPPIPFQPFVQRAFVPAGAQVFFHGDLHGDVHSLVAWIDWLNRNGYLQDFHIIRPDVYLVFLGDYTDRGMYGIEVLYTMLRLKLDNPTQVLIVRGNHEDVTLASRYGFLVEGREKFGREFDAKRVFRLYDFLPVVLYLGCGTNMVQCNHGGMEPGFNPHALLDAPENIQYQLLGPLRQRQYFREHPDLTASLNPRERTLMESTVADFQPESPTSPAVIGFMWNDFSVVHGEPQLDYDPGRAFIYGEGLTKYLLEHGSGSTRRLRAVFRAHQQATIQNSMMRRLIPSHGVYRHWQETDSQAMLLADPAVLARQIETKPERAIPANSVWTFNVCPDSVYGEALGYSFDTFGILTTAPAFEDWRLRVVNQTIRTP